MRKFLENGQVAFDQWAKTSEAMAKGALDLSCEMARFSLDRLKEDLAVCETLRGCQNPSEAFDCNRRFAERATTQYLEYAGKLSDLLAQAARVAFPAPPQSRASRGEKGLRKSPRRPARAVRAANGRTRCRPAKRSPQLAPPPGRAASTVVRDNPIICDPCK